MPEIPAFVFFDWSNNKVVCKNITCDPINQKIKYTTDTEKPCCNGTNCLDIEAGCYSYKVTWQGSYYLSVNDPCCDEGYDPGYTFGLWPGGYPCDCGGPAGTSTHSGSANGSFTGRIFVYSDMYDTYDPQWVVCGCGGCDPIVGYDYSCCLENVNLEGDVYGGDIVFPGHMVGEFVPGPCNIAVFFDGSACYTEIASFGGEVNGENQYNYSSTPGSISNLSHWGEIINGGLCDDYLFDMAGCVAALCLLSRDQFLRPVDQDLYCYWEGDYDAYYNDMTQDCQDQQDAWESEQSSACTDSILTEAQFNADIDTFNAWGGDYTAYYDSAISQCDIAYQNRSDCKKILECALAVEETRTTTWKSTLILTPIAPCLCDLLECNYECPPVEPEPCPEETPPPEV